MTNTEGLDNMNFDVLTEIGNIGAGNAVTALSQMINAKVDMYVPQVKMLTGSILILAMILPEMK